MSVKPGTTLTKLPVEETNNKKAHKNNVAGIKTTRPSAKLKTRYMAIQREYNLTNWFTKLKPTTAQ